MADVHEEAVKTLFKLMWEEAPDFSVVATDDALFTVPGAPPLPLPVLAGMMKAMKDGPFPDWSQGVRKAKDQPLSGDGPIKIETKQLIGKIANDIPAMGPFPAVALVDVNERGKTSVIHLPWEAGVYTFKDGKISLVEYSGVENTAVDNETTTMDLDPPVGFPCVYAFLGHPLPPPPSE